MRSGKTRTECILNLHNSVSLLLPVCQIQETEGSNINCVFNINIMKSIVIDHRSSANDLYLQFNMTSLMKKSKIDAFFKLFLLS